MKIELSTKTSILLLLVLSISINSSFAQDKEESVLNLSPKLIQEEINSLIKKQEKLQAEFDEREAESAKNLVSLQQQLATAKRELTENRERADKYIDSTDQVGKAMYTASIRNVQTLTDKIGRLEGQIRQEESAHQKRMQELRAEYDHKFAKLQEELQTQEALYEKAMLNSPLVLPDKELKELRQTIIESLKKSVVKIKVTTFEEKQKVGTGFIVRLEQDAVYIVTAAHVVEGTREIKVEFFTRRNRLIPADVIGLEGGDPQGLAVLLVGENIPSGLLALKLTSSGFIQGGESVTTIGFRRVPYVSWGVIQGNIVGQEGKTIIFSGPVDEGNSGGPLMKEGQVIGIVTEVSGNLAYAIPTVIAQYVLRGWGVAFEEGIPRPTATPPP
jgi:S1-C subfamily serine protease